MHRRIQAKNFRCLRDVKVALNGPTHILVGPIASGKGALLDVCDRDGCDLGDTP